MIHFRYGTQWDWRDSDGLGGGYGSGFNFGTQKVAWDVRNKIIFVNEGVTQLNVKIDIYSAWKQWVLASPEYPLPSYQKEAVSAIGGEPLNDTLNVGSTFFLENGWRIQPFATKKPYILTVNGNIYTREAGGNPFLFAEGVSVNLTRSNLIDQLVANASVTEADYAAIAERVWAFSKNEIVSSSSYGQLVQNIDSDLSIVNTKIDKTLTTGEFLALK